MGEEGANEGKPRREMPAGRKAMCKVALIGKLRELQEKAVEHGGETAPCFDRGWRDGHTSTGRVALKFDLVATECSKAVGASTDRCGWGH